MSVIFDRENIQAPYEQLGAEGQLGVRGQQGVGLGVGGQVGGQQGVGGQGVGEQLTLKLKFDQNIDVFTPFTNSITPTRHQKRKDRLQILFHAIHIANFYSVNKINPDKMTRERASKLKREKLRTANIAIVKLDEYFAEDKAVIDRLMEDHINDLDIFVK